MSVENEEGIVIAICEDEEVLGRVMQISLQYGIPAHMRGIAVISLFPDGQPFLDKVGEFPQDRTYLVLDMKMPTPGATVLTKLDEEGRTDIYKRTIVYTGNTRMGADIPRHIYDELLAYAEKSIEVARIVGLITDKLGEDVDDE